MTDLFRASQSLVDEEGIVSRASRGVARVALACVALAACDRAGVPTAGVTIHLIADGVVPSLGRVPLRVTVRGAESRVVDIDAAVLDAGAIDLTYVPSVASGVLELRVDALSPLDGSIRASGRSGPVTLVGGSASATVRLGAMREVFLDARNKVDLLFVLDNSGGAPVAAEASLVEHFEDLLAPLRVLSTAPSNPVTVDLHVGVVTSDYGAGATGAPGCERSPGGQGGALQALGWFAPTGCQQPVGDRFLHYDFANDGVDNNLPSGQGLDQTFACMAAVGASGCGFTHLLESAYAALHNNMPENQGFLRDDAVLAVVFVTDGDDVSAPPTTDLFDKTQTAQYGYEDAYRATRFGVVCCPPGRSSCSDGEKVFPPYGDSGGALAGCVPAPDGVGLEYDVRRYVDFFTKPSAQGGVKVNPGDVILASLAAPTVPFATLLANPGTAGGSPYVTCGALDESSNPPCVPVLQHSCVDPRQPTFWGDPDVRLSTVVRAARSHAELSICDDIPSAASGIGQLIASHLSPGCVTVPLADPADPFCEVVDVTVQIDGTTAEDEVPACADAAGARPCWQVRPTDLCAGLSPDGVQLVVVGDAPLGGNTSTWAACATPPDP